MDLIGRKVLLEVTNELLKAPPTLSDRIGERAIEFAVQQELPVLGIEAHDVRRQHIDAEIGRELRNGLAILRCKLVFGIPCHELSIRKPQSPADRAPSGSRALVSALALLDKFAASGPLFARQ